MAWGWLKKFGKGAAKAAPEILDVASIAMPGPAAAAAHKSADVIREIRQQREASAATPPINPVPSELLKAASEIVSTVVDAPTTAVVDPAPSTVLVPIPSGGSLADKIAATQQYISLLERVIALEKQLGGSLQ